MNIEETSTLVVDTAFHLHKDLGPGLLESVYESVLARMLAQRGLKVERQKAIAFDFQGMHFDDGLRVDLLVNDHLIIDLQFWCGHIQRRHKAHCEQTRQLRVVATSRESSNT
jgi:GxxExxY protein